MKQEILSGIKKVAAGAAVTGVDAARRVVYDHEDMIIQKVAEDERTYAIECAAAALVDAQIPDAKVVSLLQKYYRLDQDEAAMALGKGRLMVARMKNTKSQNSHRANGNLPIHIF